MRKPLTMENYLEARAISDPIHLFDCVMPCAGAEAFLVCREEDARAMQPAIRAGAVNDRAPQRLSRTIRSSIGAAGRWTGTIYGAWRASSRTLLIFCKPMTITR